MVKRTVYFFLFVFSFLLASCSKREYVNSLPKDSQLVAQIDVVDLFQKAGFEDEKISGVLQELIHHPEHVGIDWNEKVYAYVSNNTMGFVAAVNDADKLTGFLEKHAKALGVTLDVDGDYTWASTDMLLVGYNDEQLLAMTIYGDGKVFRQRARKFMKQDVAESFVSNPSFQKIEASSSDLSIYAVASVLPESVLGKWLAFLPDNIDLNSLYTILAADFNTGKLDAGINFYSDNPEIQESIKNLSSSLKLQNGVFLDHIPSDFSLYGSLCCTPELVSFLKKNRETGMAMELIAQVVPFYELLDNLEDVAFYTSSSGDFMTYGQLKNTDFLTNDSWASKYGIRMLGNHSYAFGSYSFGLNADVFYLSSNPQWRDRVDATYQNDLLVSWADKVKDTYGFVMVNLPKMPEIPFLPSEIRNQLEIAAIRWTQPEHFELTVCVKNQRDNVLKVLLQPWIK